MFSKRLSTILFLGCVAALLFSCIPRPPVDTPGAEIVDWSRPDKEPKWIDLEPGIHEDAFVFVGVVDKAEREDLGRTDARANARVSLARDIATRVSTEYGFSRTSNDARYIEESAYMMSDAVLRGASASEWYTVHYSVVPQPGGTVEYFYRIYVLMKIDLHDFQNAKLNALAALTEETETPEEKLVLDRFREDVQEQRWPYSSR